MITASRPWTAGRAWAATAALHAFVGGWALLVGELMWDATRAPGSTAVAVWPGGVGVVVLGFAGLALGWAAPGLARACWAVAGLVLLPVGIATLAAAPGLGQVRPQGLDPSRMRAVAAIGGAAAIVVALALLTWLALTLLRRGGRPTSKGVAVGAAIYATLLLLLATGLVASLPAVVYQALRETRRHYPVAAPVIAQVGTAVILAMAGSALLYHAASAVTGSLSGRANLPRFWPWVLVATAVVAVGAAAARSARMQGGALAALTVPAGLLPGLAFAGLAFVGLRWHRERGPLTWRQMWTAWAWGAVCATFAAAMIEIAAEFAVFALALSRTHAFALVTNGPGYRGLFEHIDRYLTQREVTGNTLLIYALIGPFVEELTKGFGYPIAVRACASARDAFGIGVLVGAGFAAFEGVGYVALAVHGGANQWWSGALVRAGSTTLHCLATGLVALGWYGASRGRWWRLPPLFLAAWALHGAWNGASVLVGQRVLAPTHGLSDVQLELLLNIGLGAIAVLNLLLIWAIGARLRSCAPAAAVSQPRSVAGAPGGS